MTHSGQDELLHIPHDILELLRLVRSLVRKKWAKVARLYFRERFPEGGGEIFSLYCHPIEMKSFNDLEGRKSFNDLEGRKSFNDLEGRKSFNDLEGRKSFNDLEGRKSFNDLEGRKSFNDLEVRYFYTDLLLDAKNYFASEPSVLTMYFILSYSMC